MTSVDESNGRALPRMLLYAPRLGEVLRQNTPRFLTSLKSDRGQRGVEV
jgi:hypothetical protein